MILLALIYILLTFGALVALCIMILRIGAMIGTCRQTGAAARAAAVTIATGFATIGAGGLILIGTLLPLAISGSLFSLMLALGLAGLCLGLGFTHAIGTLRAVVAAPDQGAPRQQPEPA